MNVLFWVDTGTVVLITQRTELAKEHISSPPTTMMDLIDVLGRNNPLSRQYTWARIVESRCYAGRLDRIYLSGSYSTRVVNCYIVPVVFTDHHMVLMELVITSMGKQKSLTH